MDDRNPLGEPAPQDDSGALRKWWNGLGGNMREQASQPQSELWKRFLIGALTQAPAGLASRMGAMTLSRPGPPEYSSRLPTSGTLEAMYGDNMHTPSDLNAAFSTPSQPRASNTNAAAGGADPMSYYRALLDQKRGQFTVIPGDKP